MGRLTTTSLFKSKPHKNRHQILAAHNVSKKQNKTKHVPKGRGAHSVFQKSKKYFNSSELGVLSTTANSNLGSVDTGAVAAVREEQKQDFDQNQDSGPSYS